MVSFRCLWQRDGLRDVTVGYDLTPQKLGDGGVNLAHTCRINRHLSEDQQGLGRYWREKTRRDPTRSGPGGCAKGPRTGMAQIGEQRCYPRPPPRHSVSPLRIASQIIWWDHFYILSQATRLGALLELLSAVCPAGNHARNICCPFDTSAQTPSYGGVYTSQRLGDVLNDIIREDPDGDLLYAQHLVLAVKVPRGLRLGQ